jgi:hypothetical protein
MTEVLHLFYLDSSGCCSSLDSEIQERMKSAQGVVEQEKAKALEGIKQRKEDATALLKSSFSLTSEELCMLCLRQSFLISQPVISEIVKNLMQKLFPETMADSCIQFFGSKDGPWDIFSVFSSILNFPHPKFVLLVDACVPHEATPPHRDYARERLRGILYDIFHVRNMWAHVGACDADCRKSLQAIIDFIAFSQSFVTTSQVDCCVEKLVCIGKKMNDHSDVKLSIDDIAYCFFLRSIRGLSKICAELCAKFPDLIVSKELQAQITEKQSSPATNQRRQSKEIEIREVALAIKSIRKLPKNHTQGLMHDQAELLQLTKDCELIRVARNSIAHATVDRTKVIHILVALGAVARVIEFLNQGLQQQKASASDSSHGDLTARIDEVVNTIKLNQAVLMRLCRKQTGNEEHLFDLNALLTALADSVDSQVVKCPYFSLAKQDVCCDATLWNSHSGSGGGTGLSQAVTNFKKMQLILARKIAGPCCGPEMKAKRKELGIGKNANFQEGPTNWLEKLRSLKPEETQNPELKSCRTVLQLVSRVPPDARASVDTAVDWLLSAPEVESDTLLQACGLQLLEEHLSDRLKAKTKEGKLSPSEKFLKQLFESHRRQKEFFSNMNAAIDNYEQECRMSQRFSDAEGEFLRHLERNSNLECPVGEKAQQRLVFFETKYSVSVKPEGSREQKFFDRLQKCSQQVLAAVEEYSAEICKKDSFLSLFSRTDDLQLAKDDLKRYREFQQLEKFWSLTMFAVRLRKQEKL